MDFHRYPVDEQYCEVKFESFGFSNKQVQSENRNISWLIFIIVFPDSNEMDGFLSQQCQPEHLPCSIFFQCPADGQLQHRLLWTVLPRTHNEGKIFCRLQLRIISHLFWHLTFMNMKKKLIRNATTYKMAFSMLHWIQDEFLISCLSISSYCSLTNIYSWSHCSENSPTRKL